MNIGLLNVDAKILPYLIIYLFFTDAFPYFYYVVLLRIIILSVGHIEARLIASSKNGEKPCTEDNFTAKDHTFCLLI